MLHQTDVFSLLFIKHPSSVHLEKDCSERSVHFYPEQHEQREKRDRERSRHSPIVNGPSPQSTEGTRTLASWLTLKAGNSYFPLIAITSVPLGPPRFGSPYKVHSFTCVSPSSQKKKSVSQKDIIHGVHVFQQKTSWMCFAKRQFTYNLFL